MSTLPVNSSFELRHNWLIFHCPKVTSLAAASFSIIDVIHEFNFSEIRPTLEQKTWMSGLMMSKVETSSSLAKKCHCSWKRLNAIVSQIREGKVLHSHGGRPRVVDEESFKNCSDEIFGDSEITRKILAEHINDEYHATFNRRYPHRYNQILEHEEDLQLSRRSLKRYILKLHPHVFPP